MELQFRGLHLQPPLRHHWRLADSIQRQALLLAAFIPGKGCHDGEPILQEHRRTYQRLNKRVEFGYMIKDEFQAWATEAKLRRTQCQEGKISLEEYKAWLDETSLQKKN